MLETLFLQAGGGIFDTLSGSLPILMIPIVMYFFMIRPQQNKQKEQDEFAKGLAVGQEVCTASGIIGKIKKMDGKILTLEVDDRTNIRMTITAISKEMTDAIKK
jgi:preprotein translocase subunit YajC